METYYLKTMEIKRFRNLINLKKLKFSRRINVISGQNGVGKSTILSLICSATGTRKFHKINGENFHPNFAKYFFVYPEESFPRGKEYDDKRYYVYSTYHNEEKDFDVIKRIRLKNNENTDNRVQLIPELQVSQEVLDKYEVTSEEDAKKRFSSEFNVSVSGRIEVPTAYNSISRVFPIAEINNVKEPTNDARITTIYSTNVIYDYNLNSFYRECYNQVLPDSIDDTAEMYYSSKENISNDNLNMAVKNTKPLSKSVGQDALGSIVACLADFKFISETMKEDYKGGILCIDEVDVSLHPAAQKKLLNLLYDQAKALNLQIFVTTHSMTFLEEVCRRTLRNSKDYSVNYLTNRYNPRLLVDPTIENIKADLQLSGTVIRPTVQVYFEDEMSLKVHMLLLDAADKLNIDVNKSVSVNYVALKGGKDFLRTVEKKDPYFKMPLVILDADSRFSASESKKYISEYVFKDYFDSSHTDVKDPQNFMRLPGYFAPESYLYRIYQRYCQIEMSDELRKEHDEFWEFIENKIGWIPTNAQYMRQNWTINNEKFDNSKLKKLPWGKILTDIFENVNILEFYYSYSDKPERHEELLNYINKYNSLLERQEKMVAASRF